MPAYKRIEFLIFLKKIADATDKEGIKRGQSWISTNEKREKLVIATDGTINTSHAVNKAFVQKYWEDHPELKDHIPAANKTFIPGGFQAMGGDSEQKPTPLPEMGKATAAVKRMSEEPGTSELSDEELIRIYSEKGFDALMLLTMPATQINRLHKIADILKKDSSTQLDELRRQKQEGELIPTALVKTVLIMFKKSIMVAVENEIEQFITDVGQKYNISDADRAYYRSKIPEVLTRTSDESVTQALNDTDTIVNDFSDTRGRGERK